MSKKIAFIGAGSFGFTRGLVRDILSFPAFNDCTISLMDINDQRLEFIKDACEKIVKEGNYSAKVEATKSRVEALKGADGVLCTILSGDIDVWRHDIEIPAKYGVDINVGDTRGPSGAFRALRTIPVMLDICEDIRKYCPKAIFLNYTNPMAMLCRAMQEKYPDLTITGLCHSVQGTAEMLARWIDAPMDEITYKCVGINHQAHYLEFKQNGEDVIPKIKDAVLNNKDIYNEEIVRNELFLHFGYYITESSGHNSEYCAWFRKRKDLIEKYCTDGTGWNPGLHAFILNEYLARQENWDQEIRDWFEKPVELERGKEYAAYIFNACFGDHTIFEFNGNVRNIGLVDNLPEGACVEVPVVATQGGIKPIACGKLPDQLALMNSISSQIEEMIVKASLTGDKELVYQALYFDPLTAAVLSLAEIKEMVDEMFEKNKDYLPQFK